MRKKQNSSFLDTSVSYKTGIKSEEYDSMLADAKKRALIQYQMKVEQERREKARNKWKEVKEHAIPFGLVHVNFKIAFLLSVIAFIGNIILSILLKDFRWSNLLNLLASIIIFYAGKHLYAVEEDFENKKINTILRNNICQISSDVLNYKIVELIREKADIIIDGITVFSIVCFALLPSSNILYSLCVLLSLFGVFLALGKKDFVELDSHLQTLNTFLLIGLFVKALYHLLFVSVYIHIDYMNVALLFFSTCLKMWITEQ